MPSQAPSQSYSCSKLIAGFVTALRLLHQSHERHTARSLQHVATQHNMPLCWYAKQANCVISCLVHTPTCGCSRCWPLHADSAAVDCCQLSLSLSQADLEAAQLSAQRLRGSTGVLQLATQRADLSTAAAAEQAVSQKALVAVSTW
jgi:hypothetical protein